MGVHRHAGAVQALFENRGEGARLGDFLEWFSSVSRQQAEAVLE